MAETPIYAGRTKPIERALRDAGLTPVLPDAAPAVALDPVLAVRGIPEERIFELASLATEVLSASDRISLIREAAELTHALREAAEGYYRISHERGTDAIAMETVDMADSFSEASEAALEALLALIIGEPVVPQMDQIQLHCAELGGVA
ncbi:hypothetical protein MASR1M32_12320 [Rhodobacter sp.]